MVHSTGGELNTQKVKALIDQGNAKINSTLEESILVVGNTGSGKSTIINALLDRELVIVKKGWKYGVDLKPNQKKCAQIGMDFSSQTTLPQYYVHDSKGEVYYDLPGFKDNRSVEYDIANAFYIERLFKYSNKIKILLTISYEKFKDDKAIEISETIESLGEIFREISQIEDCLSVVVTKADRDTKIEDLRDYFKDLFESKLSIKKIQENSLSKNVERLYSHLAYKVPLGISYAPVARDSEFVLDLSVRNAINNTKYVQSPAIELPISHSSINHVHTLFDECKKETTDFYKELREKVVISICNKKPGSKTDLADFLIKYYLVFKKLYDLKNVMDQRIIQVFDLIMEPICQIFGLKYTLNNTLSVVCFCSKILKEEPKSLVDLTYRDFNTVLQLFEPEIKKAFMDIKSDFSNKTNAFISALRNYTDKISSNEVSLYTCKILCENLLGSTSIDNFGGQLLNFKKHLPEAGEASTVNQIVELIVVFLNIKNAHADYAVNEKDIFPYSEHFSKCREVIGSCETHIAAIEKKREILQEKLRIIQLAEDYNTQGREAITNKQYASALAYFVKAHDTTIEPANKVLYKQNQIRAHQGMGIELFEKKLYEEAVKCFQKAYGLSDDFETKNSCKVIEAECYNQLGSRCNDTYLQYENALEYFIKAYNTEPKSADKKRYLDNQAVAYMGMAKNYFCASNFDKAIEYYQKAHNICDDLEMKKTTKNRQALVYNQLGVNSHNNQKNYKQSYEYFKKGYDLTPNFPMKT
jgi:tetratricopeptide (TPR) repeat protein/predicted GTPase